MGAVHSSAGPVQIAVLMPSKGNKPLKNKFTNSAPSNGSTVKQYFEAVVLPLLEDRSLCGDLIKTGVVLRGSSCEVEVDSLDDDAAMYADMGLTKAIFYVEQPDVFFARAPDARDVANVLVRERILQLPAWGHTGRPALSELFGELRKKFEQDGVGFSGSAGLKTGCEWMQALVKILYKISPFHAKFKARGHPIPDIFSFSAGADDYKKKGRSEPMMTQEVLQEEKGKLDSLILYPHLDLPAWETWRCHLVSLHDCLGRVLQHMKAQNDAANARLAKAKEQPSIFNSWTNQGTATVSGIDFREAVTAPPLKYMEIEKALKSLQPYHPLSLTYFEPTDRAERYRWLCGLQLSFPIALLKVAVGSTFGVLVWAMKRDEDLIAVGDQEEISVAQSLVQPLVPKLHGQAQRRAFSSKIKDICHMPSGVARYIYRELTGDESDEMTLATKERQSFLDERLGVVESFCFACGDAELIPDLRVLSNARKKGTTCFTEFWECVSEELDSMTLAADDRRHGGVVAFLSEVISQKRLYDSAQQRFNAKLSNGLITSDATSPSLRWFRFQFWPSNEHVRTSWQYTGRFQMKLQLQVRNLRKSHAHSYYCAKQKKLVEAWVHKYRDFCTAGQPDDKANGTIGEPGTATSFLSRQKKALSSVTSSTMQAMDHDAGSSKLRFIPSVFLKQEIPESLDGSWLRGQVYVTLKNNLFEASEANKTLAEIMGCLHDCKPNVWLHADGGGEHHVGHPTVIAAAIAFFRHMHDRVDRLIKTRGCPYHSYLHEVERVMSILNLGLYGVALERPIINHDAYPGMEERFTSLKTTAELRAAGKRYPQFVKGLDHALQPMYELLYQRFETLDLKGTPILRGQKVSSEDADKFFDEIKELLEPCEQSIQRGDFKRKHLSSPLLREFMDTHCILDPYKIEVYKGCWHSQLCSLRASHFGVLPEEQVRMLYSTFKCKFGCPPPQTPASVFVAMHEVPRPKKAPGVAKYESFEDCYGTPTPLDLPPLKAGALQEIAPPGVLDKDKVQGTIACTSCRRLRCVYVKLKLSSVTVGVPAGLRSMKDVLDQALDANSSTYSCGADLDLTGFENLSGLCRPYVRLKLDCSQHMELQLYSSACLPRAESQKICGYCGEEGELREADAEASTVLPVCDPCLAQHKKSRPSGRQLARFDRAGTRERNASAAQVRGEQVSNARAQVEQQRQAQGPPPSKRQRQEPEQAGGSENNPPVNSPMAAQRSQEHPAANHVGCEMEEDSERQEPDYFVHKIHDVRYVQRRLEYLIEWEDFPEEDNFTWEPTANLLPGYKDELNEFKQAYLAEGKVWPTQVGRNQQEGSSH